MPSKPKTQGRSRKAVSKKPSSGGKPVSRLHEVDSDPAWIQWLASVCDKLGFLPRHHGVHIQDHVVGELGVPHKLLYTAWTQHVTPDEFVAKNQRYTKAANENQWEAWVADLFKRLGEPFPKLLLSARFKQLGVSLDDAKHIFEKRWSTIDYIESRGLNLIECDMRGDVDEHDHMNGTRHCRACRAEDAEEREGGIPWYDWCTVLVEQLTGEEAPKHPPHDSTLRRAGIDIKDATNMWARNFTVAAYMRLRKLEAKSKKLVPLSIKLYEDDGEMATALGRAMHSYIVDSVKAWIDKLLQEEPNASLRDLEGLAHGTVQIEISRAIIERRRRRMHGG
jgi:hypothetical protein